MHELTEIVVPNVMAKWERLAYCMRYKPRDVETFRKDSRDSEECCMRLFTNWLESAHGPTPKTYQTLLNHIKKIDDLIAASEEIERRLIKGKTKQAAYYSNSQFNTSLYICYSSTYAIILNCEIL